EYIPSDEATRRQAEYEAKYARYRDVPQPRIVAVRSDVDIYPDERRVEIRGTYRLANRSAAPIAALHVGVPPGLEVRRLDLPPHRVVVDDRRLGYAIHELATPLAPGQEMLFGFELRVSNPGFVNNDSNTAVVANGSFFHSRQFPSLGYLAYRELTDPSERRRQGLRPARREALIDDPVSRRRNDLS